LLRPATTDGFEALPYFGQLMSAVTDIQGACANHGVILDLNVDADPRRHDALGWAAIVRAQPAGHGCRSTAARNEPSI
jgi:hypothetical protein